MTSAFHTALAGLFLAISASASHAASCRDVAAQLSRDYRLDTTELAETLASLAASGKLPDRYVSKREAQAAGWRPGQSLWQVLPGKSIGGDAFGNREGRLPAGRYREADLDYRGGKRNAKRLVFTPARNYITIDHYETFHEVPPCR